MKCCECDVEILTGYEDHRQPQQTDLADLCLQCACDAIRERIGEIETDLQFLQDVEEDWLDDAE